MIDEHGGYTPTPVISHAILSYNQTRKTGLADGIVISPSHNPSGNSDLAVLEKSDRSNLIYPMFAYAGSKRLFAEIRKDGRTA